MAEPPKKAKEMVKWEEWAAKKEKEALKVWQVQGSTAGAGSGDFHYYRIARRIEQDREKLMTKAFEAQEKLEEFNAKRQAAAEEEEAKRQARAEKRKRKKEHKAAVVAEQTGKKPKVAVHVQEEEVKKPVFKDDGSFMAMFLAKQAELEKAK